MDVGLRNGAYYALLGIEQARETLQKIIQTASDIGIEVLTVYAFSTENWKRPEEEVGLLMRLIAEYLDNSWLLCMLTKCSFAILVI